MSLSVAILVRFLPWFLREARKIGRSTRKDYTLHGYTEIRLSAFPFILQSAIWTRECTNVQRRLRVFPIITLRDKNRPTLRNKMASVPPFDLRRNFCARARGSSDLFLYFLPQNSTAGSFKANVTFHLQFLFYYILFSFNNLKQGISFILQLQRWISRCKLIQI